MDEAIRELIEYVGAAREALLAVARSLTPEQLAARPEEGAWSPAEVLEHLAVVERRVAAGIAARVAAARVDPPAAGAPPADLESRLRSFAPAAGRRFPAPPEIAPVGAMTRDEAVDALLGSRAALLRSVEGADGLPLEDLVFPHPIFGDLSVPDWILFVGLHERRHLAQIERALARGASA